MSGFSQTASPLVAEKYRKDRIIIQGKAGLAIALAHRHATENVRVRRSYPHLNNMQVLELPNGAEVERVLDHYRRSGEVEVAEPDYLIYPAAIPNDPGFTNGVLYALGNFEMPGADISAPLGWDTLTSASNVVVAVVDSGIRYTHEDLAANCWSGPGGVHGFNAIDNSNDPSDDYGHGTQVAGVVGAVGNNGIGTVGVAWQVQIMACKFFDNLGHGSASDAIECIDYARTNGAKIINASFVSTSYSSNVFTTISSCRDAGVIVVCAAGNSGGNNDRFPYYPASYQLDNIVSVAATDRRDLLWVASNYGATNVDLAAPGSEIFTTYFTSDEAYVLDSGTSFATPFVSGALALMIAHYYPTNYTPVDHYRPILDRLLVSVDALPSLVGKCVTGGRLNLNKALNHFAPTLTAMHGTSFGGISLNLKGETSQQYIVEASLDFANWTPIATNSTSSAGTFAFTINTAAPFQFYRASLAP